jgi:DNA-binding LacI/PurR family transcriptional regulator
MKVMITEQQHKMLVETRLKGYRRFLKDNIFSFLPDYILKDLFRETGDMGFKDLLNVLNGIENN